MNMNTKGLLFYYVLIMLFIGTNTAYPQERVIEKIQIKDGLVYALDETEPFSGKLSGTRNNRKIMVSYKNGILEGPTIIRYANGNKKSEDDYKNGKKQGLSRRWNEAGVNSFGVFYIDDVPQWLSNKFYENGQPKITTYFQGDTFSKLIETLLGGKTTADPIFATARKNRSDIGWYENGQKKYEQFYKNGLREGVVVQWFENGQKKSEQNYVLGIREGMIKEWFDDGAVKSEQFFANGKRQGSAIEWHNNGQKKSHLNFSKGEPIGKARWWDQNGNLFTDFMHQEPNKTFSPSEIILLK